MSGVGFRGRIRELDQLTRLISRAAEGAPFALTIGGEAGIGKSRLVEEATQAVTGIRVLFGKASELERERSSTCRAAPWKPMSARVRQARREIEAELASAYVVRFGA